MLYESTPEPATTPFIPPLPSPESLAPPVIPPSHLNHKPPAWAQQPPTPGQYPYYPATPYNTTPFIPNIPSAQSTPGMHPPGSYFAPPSNLPHVYDGPSGQGHGFSSDYTGYPNANPNVNPNGNPSPFVPPSQPPPGTPWAAPPGQPPPGTPWAAPPGQPPPGTPWAAPGTGFSAFQQPLPSGPPPGWGPQLGAFTPAGYPAGYPMVPPYATPAAAGWGMPMHPAYGHPGVPPGPPGGYAGHTPWMHPTVPPPAPPQPPDTANAHFRWTNSADHIDPFAEGPHYGPVLEPFLVRAVVATIRVNPLLAPPTDNNDYLRWNMIFSTSTCYRTTESQRSWIKGRDAPATFPRLSQIRIISRTFPWMISVKARRKDLGVTCGEVVEAIAAYMQGDVARKEYESTPSRRRREIWAAYQFNRSTDINAPGGQLGEQLRRLDWLGNNSRFGGIIQNDDYVKEACGDVLPCTFELQCLHNYPLNREEAAEQQRRQARDRSRPRSTGSGSGGRRETYEDDDSD